MMMMKASNMMRLIFVMMMMSMSMSIDDSIVRDLFGSEVKAGVDDYYLFAGARYQGGVVLSGNDSCKTCPEDVVAERSSLVVPGPSIGLPVSFHPVVDHPNGLVPVSTDVNIKFHTAANSTVWRMVYDRCIDNLLVSTGGVVGNPGPQTVNNWFKLVRLSPDIVLAPQYDLVFCPSVCDSCAPACAAIVEPREDQASLHRRLVLRRLGTLQTSYSFAILPKNYTFGTINSILDKKTGFQ